MVGDVFNHNPKVSLNMKMEKTIEKRINLNGNTIGFRPQTQKLRAHTKLIVSCESTAGEVPFEWSQHRTCPQTQELELQSFKTVHFSPWWEKGLAVVKSDISLSL